MAVNSITSMTIYMPYDTSNLVISIAPRLNLSGACEALSTKNLSHVIITVIMRRIVFCIFSKEESFDVCVNWFLNFFIGLSPHQWLKRRNRVTDRIYISPFIRPLAGLCIAPSGFAIRLRRPMPLFRWVRWYLARDRGTSCWCYDSSVSRYTAPAPEGPDQSHVIASRGGCCCCSC